MKPYWIDPSLLAPLPHPNKLTFSSDVHGFIGSALRVGAGYLVADAAGAILGTAADAKAAAALAHASVA